MFQRRRILYRLLFGIVPITAGALLISFLCSRYFLDKMLKRYVPDSNIKTAEIISLKVSGFVNSARVSLSGLSDSISNENSLAKKNYLLRKMALRSPDFKYIYIASRSGTIIADTSVGKKPRMQKASGTALKAFSGDEVFSGVMWPKDGLPYMEICVPTTRWRKIVSVVCGEIDFVEIWNIMDKTKLGKTGYSILVTTDGRYLSHPDKAVVLSGHRIPAGEMALMKSGQGSFMSEDTSGQSILTTYSTVSGLNWKAMVRQDSSEVFLFWLLLKRYLSLVILILILFVIVFIYIFSLRFVRPIEELTHATGIIASGDLQHQIPVQGGDEIGILANSFNLMVQKLQKNQKILIHSEKLSALGRFAASIAHEIQNPITGLLGYVYLLKHKQSEEKVLEFAGDMEDELLNIQGTVERLLAMSRQSEIRFEEVSLNSVAERSMTLVEHYLTRYKQISITADLEDSLPLINGDKLLLQQAVLNLLINSGEAIAEKGNIKITTWHENGRVCLEVCDNGSGIDEKEIGCLFEPFFSTKLSKGGTGLGLYVTGEIIKMHNGEIKVESGEGKTRFTLLLNG